MMTPKQQAIFRSLVSRAWETTVSRFGWNFPDAKTGRAARDAWYRSKLLEEFGVETTKDLDDRDSYARLCALYEAEIGDSIYWQLRAYGGKEAEAQRRLLHEIRELCCAHDIDEDYARSIARQSLQSDKPDLNVCSARTLLAVLRALRIHVKRLKAAA